jgi:hypothetical protein
MSRLHALAIITRNIRMHLASQSEGSAPDATDFNEKKVEWKGRMLDPRVVEALQLLRAAEEGPVDEGDIL